MTFRRISGADDPNAIKVKFATVGFQTGTLVLTKSPVYGFSFRTIRFPEVICSIALISEQHISWHQKYLPHEDVSDDVHSKEHPDE